MCARQFLKKSQKLAHMKETITVGITYDTKNDFKLDEEKPWDWDAEFEVSVAVDDITRALEDLGHQTIHIGSGEKLLENFREIESQVDIVFNIAEGMFGRARESQIPSLLEMARMPFVGSDAYTLAIALNKWHTKVIAHHYGINTPAFSCIERYEQLDNVHFLSF